MKLHNGISIKRNLFKSLISAVDSSLSIKSSRNFSYARKLNLYILFLPFFCSCLVIHLYVFVEILGNANIKNTKSVILLSVEEKL